MTEHLTNFIQEKLIQEKLPKEEALSYNVHLSSCTPCRNEFIEVQSEHKSIVNHFNSYSRKTKKYYEPCNEFSSEDIAAFIEQKLPEQENVLLEKHLAVCEFCLWLVGFLSKKEKEDIDPSCRIDEKISSGIKEFLRRTFNQEKKKDENKSKCRNCSAIVNSDSLFCPQCGTPFNAPAISCFKCQKPISWEVKFCPNCGQSLQPENKDQQNLIDSVTAWLPEGVRKNRWLVGAIAAILGSFAFPAIFLQFLLAAGIMGGMWIFDHQRQELIKELYSAWKSGDKSKVESILHKLKENVHGK